MKFVPALLALTVITSSLQRKRGAQFAHACVHHHHHHRLGGDARNNHGENDCHVSVETQSTVQTETGMNSRGLQSNATAPVQDSDILPSVSNFGDRLSSALGSLFSPSGTAPSSPSGFNQSKSLFDWDNEDSPIRIGDSEWSSVRDFKKRRARCSVPDRTPEEKRANDDILLKFMATSSEAIITSSSGGLRKLQTVTPINVPVYFTCVTSGSSGLVTASQVAQQISVLNKAYGPYFVFTVRSPVVSLHVVLDR
jgi:hypothetical protein